MVFVINSIYVHRFSFENTSSAGYWSLHEVNVTIRGNGTFLFTNTRVGAPLQFSYSCSQGVVFVNGSNNMFNVTSSFQVPYFILQFIGRVRAA
jgi:hypothetical protein